MHHPRLARSFAAAILPVLVLVGLPLAGYAATGAATATNPTSIDAGIEYTVVKAPMRAEPGDDVEVLELFWYGCPHCYTLEPAIDAWRTDLPDGVTFRRMPAAAASHWLPHARAFYAAEQLGVLEQLHRPLFKAIHDERRKVFTDDEIIAFAADQGIDEAAFREAYQSFAVDTKVRRAAELVRQHQISGVPSVLVNGKFVTSATQAGGRDAMFNVIDELVAIELADSQALR